MFRRKMAPAPPAKSARADCLRRVVADLSPSERRLFQRVIVEQWSLARAAAEMTLSPAEVETILVDLLVRVERGMRSPAPAANG